MDQQLFSPLKGSLAVSSHSPNCGPLSLLGKIALDGTQQGNISSFVKLNRTALLSLDGVDDKGDDH